MCCIRRSSTAQEGHELGRKAFLHGAFGDDQAELGGAGDVVLGLGAGALEQGEDEHLEQDLGGELSEALDQSGAPADRLEVGPQDGLQGRSDLGYAAHREAPDSETALQATTCLGIRSSRLFFQANSVKSVRMGSVFGPQRSFRDRGNRGPKTDPSHPSETPWPRSGGRRPPIPPGDATPPAAPFLGSRDRVAPSSFGLSARGPCGSPTGPRSTVEPKLPLLDHAPAACDGGPGQGRRRRPRPPECAGRGMPGPRTQLAEALWPSPVVAPSPCRTIPCSARASGVTGSASSSGTIREPNRFAYAWVSSAPNKKIWAE